MTSVTCISRRPSHLTRASTSAAHTSQPIVLATITNTRVVTTTSVVNVIAIGHVAGIPATPAAFSEAIT